MEVCRSVAWTSSSIGRLGTDVFQTKWQGAFTVYDVRHCMVCFTEGAFHLLCGVSVDGGDELESF